VSAVEEEWGRDTRPEFGLFLSYNRVVDIDTIIKPLQDLRENPKPLPKMVYEGVPYVEIDNLLVAVSGGKLFAALAVSNLKDMIDASNGKTAADDLLVSSERFKAWNQETSGVSVRGWLDIKAVGRLIEREFKENSEAGSSSRRRDYFSFLSSKVLEWENADTLSFTGSFVKDSTLRFKVAMSEPISYAANVLPPQATMTSFKYLPESTVFVGGVGMPKITNLARTTDAKLKEARNKALELAPELFETRNVFDMGSLQRASGGLSEFRELLLFGFRRLGNAALSTGVELPYTGSAADFAKQLKDDSAAASLFGFQIKDYVAFNYDRDAAIVSGSVIVENAQGQELNLMLGERMQWDRDALVDEARDVDASKMISMFIDSLEFTFGVTTREVDGFLGNHAILGMAVNRTRHLGRDYNRMFNEDGIFGVIALRNVEEFERHAAGFA
ncbi:MAG: hypothetical protein KDB07_13640, partial [Planctomycetes bacterium]|nr:hypothetical protein [Planctomycetota bacterium]